MAIVEVSDRSGCKSKLWDYDDMYLPLAINGSPAEHLPSLKKWQTRKDDVFVCSYPKSGTNWVWEIVSMLRNNKKEVTDMVFPNIEIYRTPDIDALPSPRTLQTHMRFRRLPQHFLENKGKIIYVMRNPKDIAVSMFKFILKLKEVYSGTWDDYLHLFYEGKLGYGSWYDHVRDWEDFRRENSKYPILFVTYEDIHKDCKKEITRIAKFLEVPTNSETIATIATQVQFQNFKTKKLEKCGHIYKSISKDGTDIFFRKGVVGDWRNQFTVSQSDEFDNVYEKKMKGSKLKFKFSV